MRALNSLWTCSGRMLHLTQWHKAQCENKSSTLEVRLAYCCLCFFFQNSWFLIWNLLIWAHMLKLKNAAQSSWCYKFVIWGTIHYYCITLTLVTVTKLCFKMRKEMLKGNTIHPVLFETPSKFKSNWMFSKTVGLRHAESYTEYESTRVVDMCLINIISCLGIAK